MNLKFSHYLLSLKSLLSYIQIFLFCQRERTRTYLNHKHKCWRNFLILNLIWLPFPKKLLNNIHRFGIRFTFDCKLLLIYVLQYDCAGGYDCLLESKLSLYFEEMWQHSNISSKTFRAAQIGPNFTFRQMTIPCNKFISQISSANSSHVLIFFLCFSYFLTWQSLGTLTIIGNVDYHWERWLSK